MNSAAPATMFAQSGLGLSPVLGFAILVVVVLLVIWLVLRWMAQPVKTVQKSPAPAVKTEQRAPVAPAAGSAGKVDDLKIIEGIGPKIAGVFNAAGVTSFAQLAAMTPDEITGVLHEGGIRLADPRSLPDQARLAADGKQSELKALQDALLAGRKV